MEASQTNEENEDEHIHNRHVDMSMLLLDSNEENVISHHSLHINPELHPNLGQLGQLEGQIQTIDHTNEHHHHQIEGHIQNDSPFEMRSHLIHHMPSDSNRDNEENDNEQDDDNDNDHSRELSIDGTPDNSGEDQSGKPQAIPLHPYGSISIQQLLQLQQQVAFFQMMSQPQIPPSSSPPPSSSNTNLPIPPSSSPNLLQGNSLPIPSQFQLPPNGQLPAFTPIGIDQNTGHYIVVPAPYNAVLYPGYSFPTAATATPAAPTAPVSVPAPSSSLYRTSTARKRRNYKKKQITQQTSPVEPDPEKVDEITISDPRKTHPSDLKCHEIRIGNYVKSSLREDNGVYNWDVVVKFYYGKKAIAYEIRDTDLHEQQEPNAPMKYKIEYKFSCITGIAFDGNEDTVRMIIDLKEPPSFTEKVKGIQPTTTTWRKRSDFTPDNQASIYRRHVLTFDKRDIEKGKNLLFSLTPELSSLLNSPSMSIENEADLRFPSSNNNMVNIPSPDISEIGRTKKRSKTDDTCKCSGGCSTTRCLCVRNFRSCGESCKCKNCKNPLSIIQKTINSPIDFGHDYCLRDNLLKYKQMEETLKTQVQGQCVCGHFYLKLSDCLPQYECQNCGLRLLFSWCKNELVDPDSPKYQHCRECKECKPYPSLHCSACNKCYDASSANRTCPLGHHIATTIYWNPNHTDEIEDEEPNETDDL